MSSRPSAVLFDAYGTLFDVHSVVTVAELFYPGKGETLSRLWRDKQIEYTRLVSMSATPKGGPGAAYQPFWDLTRAALRHATAACGLELPPEHEERLMNAYRALSTFPEVRPVLQSLREAGVRTGILSNGDPQMIEVAVRSAQLSSLIDVMLSADTVRRYKTDPAVYALGPQALGLPPRQILFVSSNGWDALGATWFGYTTLWVNRQGAPAETLGPAPTHVGESLRAVLPLLA